MKNLLLLLIIVGLLAAGWLNRDKLRGIHGKPTVSEEGEEEVISAAPPDPSSPRPIGTPHPAQEAQLAAVRAYPGLKIQGSALNRKFIELHAEAARHDPALLARPDWPLKLAERAAVALGGGAMPVAASPPPGGPSRLTGSALDAKPKPKGH